MSKKQIGNVGNWYGDLYVKEEAGAYFWAIENYDGLSWDEIPEYLYRSLLAFQESLEA